jgi:hypothetical protein
MMEGTGADTAVRAVSGYGTEGIMTSPTFAAPQFQLLAGRMSNLDRCMRCGSQRAAHGADWSCPQRLPASSARVMLILGALLAVAGGTLWLTGISALNMAAALALPTGILLLAIGFFSAEDQM